LQDLKHEFQEHIPFKPSRPGDQKKRAAAKGGKAEGD
jgi:hypothetical protein